MSRSQIYSKPTSSDLEAFLPSNPPDVGTLNIYSVVREMASEPVCGHFFHPTLALQTDARAES